MLNSFQQAKKMGKSDGEYFFEVLSTQMLKKILNLQKSLAGIMKVMLDECIVIYSII